MKWKISMQFKDWKLRTKFLVSFVVLIFFFLLLNSGLNYYVSISSMQSLSEQHSALYLEQVAQNFEQKLQEVEDLSFTSYKNAGFCEVIIDKQASQSEVIWKKQSIKQFLYQMVYGYDEFLFAAVYEPNGTNYSQLKMGYTTYSFEADELMSSKEMKQLNDKRGKVNWSTGNEHVLIMKRAMYDLQSSRYCGSLVIALDSNHFKKIYANKAQSDEIMFVNAEGELLIYNNQQSKELYTLSTARYGKTFSDQNHNYIVIGHVTTDQRWQILNIINMKQFTSFMTPLRFWSIIIFLIAFVTAFIHIAFLTNSITKKLQNLVNSMKALSVGVLDTVVPASSNDEIGIISNKFNQMVGTIKQLIETVSNEKIQKERAIYKQLESEYKTLQAQMNPHFLYNTLESIHSLAKIKQQHDIGEMVYLLGSLIRESISRKEQYIPLADEISFIQDYLRLQGITYESRLEVDYNLDEATLACIVPKFILQPIVENAIIHGIEQKSGKGIIVIHSYLEGDILVMAVEDNGIGMSEEERQTLLCPHDVANDSSGRTRVGLRSIHRRLQLLFGDKYGVTIESTLGEGSLIIIKQPVTSKEAMNIVYESDSN